jgi:hypothetical protein
MLANQSSGLLLLDTNLLLLFIGGKDEAEHSPPPTLKPRNTPDTSGQTARRRPQSRWRA